MKKMNQNWKLEVQVGSPNTALNHAIHSNVLFISTFGTCVYMYKFKIIGEKFIDREDFKHSTYTQIRLFHMRKQSLENLFQLMHMDSALSSPCLLVIMVYNLSSRNPTTRVAIVGKTLVPIAFFYKWWCSCPLKQRIFFCSISASIKNSVVNLWSTVLLLFLIQKSIASNARSCEIYWFKVN